MTMRKEAKYTHICCIMKLKSTHVQQQQENNKKHTHKLHEHKRNISPVFCLVFVEWHV